MTAARPHGKPSRRKDLIHSGEGIAAEPVGPGRALERAEFDSEPQANAEIDQAANPPEPVRPRRIAGQAEAIERNGDEDGNEAEQGCLSGPVSLMEAFGGDRVGRIEQPDREEKLHYPPEDGRAENDID